MYVHATDNVLSIDDIVHTETHVSSICNGHATGVVVTHASIQQDGQLYYCCSTTKTNYHHY